MGTFSTDVNEDMSRQSHLNLAHCTSHDGLNDRPTAVMQQVDLIDDEQAHELRVGAITTLTSDDVPLLGRGDNDLRGVNLALCHVHVTSQLTDL